MIRISSHKPGLCPVDDRWGQPLSVVGTYDFGYVCVQRWINLEYFESKFPDFANLPPLEKALWNVDRITADLKQRLALSNQRTVWEFNALDRTKQGRIRFVAFLHEGPHLVQWTWVDAYIRRPFWLVIARAYNFLMRFR